MRWWICKPSLPPLSSSLSLSYLWAEEPWLQTVQTVLSNWAMSLYTQGNHPLLMKKWKLPSDILPLSWEKKRKTARYFERLIQLETSHRQARIEKTIKTLLALSIRTNPSYSSEHVRDRDSVFVVAYAVLACVPGHLSKRHDTSSCISFRLSTGWAGLLQRPISHL